MKTKLFFTVFLFLISFGCKEEKKSEIEIIPASEMIYSMKDLDSPPKLKSKDLEKTFKEMMELNVEINKFYTSLDSVEQINFSLSYNFIYNVEGQLYKVQVIKSDYPELDRKITEAQKKWDYEPSLIDDNPVNFFIPWTYNPKNLSNKISPEMIERIHSDSTYFVAVENMPEPIGGMYSIQSKIKYPEEAKRNGIEGKVFIQAFIDEAGNVVEAKVIKGAGYGLDEAALDAVKQTTFTPGKQKGKPVKVQVSIPIVFKLESKITIQEILDRLKWNNNEGNIIRIANSNFSLTGRPVIKESNNRSRVIQLSGGLLYGIKTYRWIFTFENDSLSLISIEFKSASSSDKSKTYSALKNEIEKISLTKIQAQPNEWILSFDNKTLAGLKLFPGGRTADITILLSSNKLIMNTR